MVLELDVNALRRVILPRLEIRDFLDEIREEAVVDLGRGGERERHGGDEGAAEERGLPAHYDRSDFPCSMTELRDDRVEKGCAL